MSPLETIELKFWNHNAQNYTSEKEINDDEIKCDCKDCIKEMEKKLTTSRLSFKSRRLGNASTGEHSHNHKEPESPDQLKLHSHAHGHADGGHHEHDHGHSHLHGHHHHHDEP